MAKERVDRVDGNGLADGEPMPQGISIAIDGPVASGKGTIAKTLAKRLNGFYLDTGAMYRAVAVAAIERGLSVENPSDVQSILPDVNIGFDSGRVMLNGTDVSDRIRERDASHGSSVIAVYGPVREEMGKQQRSIARSAMEEGQVVVLDGRDTGTRVLPDASLKLYLTASPEVRAQRRREQLLEKAREKGDTARVEEIAEVLGDIRARDERDMSRSINPLPRNPEELGYWVLDNSGQTEEQTIQAVVDELKKRGLING